MTNSLIVVRPISRQVVNEGAAFGPFDLKDYIKTETDSPIPIQFVAGLANGDALPRGMICTSNGIVSGIPAAGTKGNYEIVVTASTDPETTLTVTFNLLIKSRIALESHELLDSLKARVWEAVGKDLPIPDIGDLINRPITAVEIYYLLERFATLTIWDVYNLDMPSDKVLINIDGVSEHYYVYDRGSCLVATPKDLFSHERTTEDALMTARAMAGEAFKRGWVIEFAGFNKMVRAAWVELQLLADKFGREVEVLHYVPTADDLKVYANRAKLKGARMG